jgi:hypothetical protein
MTEVPELVVVRAFSHPHEAYLACSALQAAGLDATIADANIVAADWLVSNAVGGVKVLVRAEDVITAREILDVPAAVEKDSQKESLLVGDPHSGTNCPRCGSDNVVHVARGKRIAVLSWLIAGVPLFPVWRKRRCQRCGFVVS